MCGAAADVRLRRENRIEFIIPLNTSHVVDSDRGIVRFVVRLAVIVFVLSGPAQSVYATSTLSLDFVLEYQSDQDAGFNSYFAFPELQSLPDPRSTATEVESPGFYYYSELEPGETHDASQSTNFSQFDDLKYTLNQPGWTLRIDAFTANPTEYSFDVDANALQDFAATPTRIAAGTEGASYASNSQPTFKWSGPAGFDAITFSLVRAADFSTVERVQLGPTTTSHMVAMPLAPGSYDLEIDYFKNLSSSPPLSTTTPTDSNGQAFTDWAGVTGFEEFVGDSVSFMVVPEPSSLQLFALALVISSIARHRIRLR